MVFKMQTYIFCIIFNYKKFSRDLGFILKYVSQILCAPLLEEVERQKVCKRFLSVKNEQKKYKELLNLLSTNWLQ